jgi:hypothetical protein
MELIIINEELRFIDRKYPPQGAELIQGFEVSQNRQRLKCDVSLGTQNQESLCWLQFSSQSVFMGLREYTRSFMHRSQSFSRDLTGVLP